jgi:hypothetical protein
VARGLLIAYAKAISSGSLHAFPRSSIPTGNPSAVKPTGTVMAGSPEFALR